MLRRIDSPGIQINEIDKSQYDSMPDYSIVGTTCLICGFADKGENYSIKWINTIQTLVDNYGYPQTEEERYFWNACAEVLNNGGICLAAKLPYDNPALDTFPYVDYKISDPIYIDADSKYKKLLKADASLTSYIQISQQQGSTYSGYIDLSSYDKYCISEQNVPFNTLRIVGIQNNQYGTMDVATINNATSSTLTTYNKIECLGIMPVVVGAAEAMFYQKLISTDTSMKELSTTVPHAEYIYAKKYNLSTVNVTANNLSYKMYAISTDQQNDYAIVSANTVENNEDIAIEPTLIPIDDFINGDKSIFSTNGEKVPFIIETYDNITSSTVSVAYLSTWSEKEGLGIVDEITEDISTYTTIADIDTVAYGSYAKPKGLKLNAMNFLQQISSNTINDYTLAKEAANCYPIISLEESDRIDSDQLKLIGVAVFNVYKDPANSQKILFQLEESFVGSLDKNAKNSSGHNIFIDNVVNEQSQLIRVFSNIDKTKNYFYLPDGTKSKYAMSNFQRASFFTTAGQIGIILGQYAKRTGKRITVQRSIIKSLNMIFENAKDLNKWNIDLVVDAGLANIAQAYYGDTGEYSEEMVYLQNGERLKAMKLSGACAGWLGVLQKYDVFCKNQRQDCMFIADGLRPFCLDGDSKIIRDTAPQNTMDQHIIPKLKWMTGLNTSYGAGYCDWFKTTDRYSGNMMWIPPSIKAMGCYIYTDAYYQSWLAPAGLRRGIVQNVVDVAFNPNQEQSGKLYVQCWNYACNYPIDGIILEGQKTFQRKKTAFDRVNVRRLFLYLEKQVRRIARYFVYEQNNAYQRQQFVDTIRPIFENAKRLDGIAEYVIKCDEDNNTPQTIDNNELHCSIAIRPVKAIEFILLNFICTNQSANVAEEIVT